MNLCHERVQRGPCQTSMIEFCAKKTVHGSELLFFQNVPL